MARAFMMIVLLLPISTFSWSFVSIGDWGLRNAAQTLVASGMSRIVAREDSRFVLSLGDNFYPKGVVSTEDPLWQEVFEDVFSDEALKAIPWISMLGNHDYRENPQAQIDYSNSRWSMPSYYFYKVFSFEGVSLRLVVLDTVMLAPEEDASKVPEQRLRAKEQLEWFEDVLKASKEDWLVVAGHFPIYSTSKHSDQPIIKRIVKPLLDKYKVDAYLCGHDHAMIHLQGGSVHYYVNGNAVYQSTLNSRTDADIVHFAHVSEGFMLHELTKDEMVNSFIDGRGALLYTHRILHKSLRPRTPNTHLYIIVGILITISTTASVILFLWSRKGLKYNKRKESDKWEYGVDLGLIRSGRDTEGHIL